MLSIFNDLKPVECHPHLCLRSVPRVHHPRIDFSTTLATYFRSAASAKIPPIALTFRLSPCRVGLTVYDLLPENPKSYDKMRPPKKDGQATTVFFHVTVMGLDSIDETSMVFDSWAPPGDNTWHAFHPSCRLTRLTYFSLKRGAIIGWGCRRTWHRSIGCWKSSGSSTCGDPIRTLRMPSQWHSKRWRFPTTTCGCTKTKPSCTWWSWRCDYRAPWISSFTRTTRKSASCRWRVVSFSLIWIRSSWVNFNFQCHTPPMTWYSNGKKVLLHFFWVKNDKKERISYVAQPFLQT